ncbi:DUF6527 family protein [Paenibacillus sp. yr247]|uniref:DUF6527 family protein n=1 Tax=Paenibacillus sp. yr247 TaxID=1761880 RepID=UPI0034A4D1AA
MPLNPLRALASFLQSTYRRLFKAEIKHSKHLGAFDDVIVRSTREATDDLLKMGTLLIVKDGTFYKWARFQCPCGCGQKQVISLESNHNPHWSIYESSGTITLQPSVHVNGQGGCGAHFFIRNNMIDWV